MRVIISIIIGWLMAGILHAAPVILVYGDSLSAGYGLPAGKGWANLLAERLNGRYRVVNASLSGETTAGGLARLEHTLAEHRPAVVLLALGANDGLRGLPITMAEQNLDQMLKRIRQKRAHTLLIGMHLPPNYGATYTHSFAQMYKTLAERNRVVLVPFMLEGFASQPEFFLADGIHPNVQAQPFILKTLEGKLATLLETARPAHSKR